MTSFRLAFHSRSARRIVEVYGDDGALVGAIYPTEDGSNAVHLVSKYETTVQDAPDGEIWVPGKFIKFGPLIDGIGGRSREPSSKE